MKRAALVFVLASALLAVGAVCTEQQAQEHLSSGTDFVFEEEQSADYVLVLDKSGSMRGEKIVQAKQAAQQLVSQLSKDDRAAIIGFDSNPTLYSGFSTDKEALSSAIGRISTGDFTQYARALERAQGLFDGNRKVVVFLSDGKPDDKEKIGATVESLVGDGVCVFTIAYAKSADESAQHVLEEIANASRQATECGGYFRAGQNEFELRYVFDEIYQTVSSDELFDVQTSVSTNGDVTLSVDATSTLNDEPVLGEACFAPRITYLLVRNNEVVREVTTTEPEHSFELPAGTYEYVVSVRETCGGECLFSGKDEGEFAVDPGASTCRTPWEELDVLLTSEEYVEVHITENGFSPQTVGTDGVVVWKNLDDAPHRVVGVDGSFSSPVIAPGEEWSKVFPPGTYAYRAEEAGFSGLLRNDQEASHSPVDLVLVLDKSGSMAGDALRSAKAAANNLVGVMSAQDRASLVLFSDQVRLAQQLTSDREQLRAAIDSVVSEGSTFYSEALRLAGQQLARSSASREQLVIFLSDGAPFDSGGKDAILSVLDENVGGACFYAIGYGEQGVEAVDLLNSMASHVQAKNECGLFYYSTADKEALSRVFGEIYAQSQSHGLEVYDVSVPAEPEDEFVMSARVRSAQNGVSVPSVSKYGCMPPANVTAVFGERRFLLEYDQGVYRGNVSLPPGEHSGVVSARLSALDEPARVVVGSERVTVRVSGFNWALWLSVLLVVSVAAYFFMRRRASSGSGFGADRGVSSGPRDF